jgi:hypothetical protein
VDILVANDNCVGELLSLAIHYFRSQGVAAVVCWTPKWFFLTNFLRKRGFLKRSVKHNIIVKRFCPEKVTVEFLTDENNWHYAFGDSDYFQTGPRIWEF